MKFNIKDYLYPFDVIKQYLSLRKSMFFSQEQLIDIQNQKLRNIILQAYQFVPYYKELFDKNKIRPQDIKTIDDLVLIPVLTKDILRERYNDLIAVNCKKYNPYINKTSGSTGSPLQFLQDKNVSIARFAFFWRIWEMAGYRPYMRWAQVDGMYVPEKDKIWKYNWQLNSLQISAYSLNETNCEKIIKKLETYKPKILRGYPSALYILAQYISSKGILFPVNIKSVITNSETLHPYQRSLMEDAFKCKVYDVYSMWEAVCLISECEYQKKHQHMEFSVMELLDEKNQVISNGQTGEITATSFYNFSMPFIRYKTGDLASLTDSSCPCGRNHILVNDIDGRIEDLIITPGGERMGALGRAFYNNTGIKYFQIVQNKIDVLEIFIVKNSLFTADTLVDVENDLKKRIGTSMQIHFNIVENIMPGKNGKRRAIINNLKKE